MKKSRITLEGMESLTHAEAKAIIKGTMAGRFALIRKEYDDALSAVEKIAEVLISAGANREEIAKMLELNDL